MVDTVQANLEGRKVFIAIPTYDGKLNIKTAYNLAQLMPRAFQHGVSFNLSHMSGCSLITMARNSLVNEFLKTDCQELLFIDSDVNFNPQDVIALLALDKEVIGGPYPKKAIKWRSVKKALEKNPDLDAQLLEKVTGDYVFNPVKGTAQFTVTEPLDVLEIGTGFMMVKREVFAKMEEAYPMIRYKPDHVGQANFDGSRYIHAFFDTVIDSKDSITGGGSDRYLSEDYMFCQMWRKIGGQIFLCPWMKTAHIGTYHFQGDMPAVANYVGEM